MPAAAAIKAEAKDLVAVAAADDRRWDIAELTQLRVRYRVAWPLSLVIDAEAQRQYNQILVFLMQVIDPKPWTVIRGMTPPSNIIPPPVSQTLSLDSTQARCHQSSRRHICTRRHQHHSAHPVSVS